MKRIFLLLVYSRLIFLLFALLAPSIIPLNEGYLGNQHFPDESYLAWIWANFDGRHFSDIVISGYRHFNFAFFPLYPLMIRILDYHLIVDPPYVGIFISTACLFLAMIMLYKIIKLDYKENIAHLSLLMLAFFPLSFFYHSMYSDSLFLLLSITSFYWARRGNWVLAGIFGGLVTLTRIAGIALLPALLVEWYLQNKGETNKIIKNFTKKNILPFLSKFLKTGFVALVLTSFGFLSYLVYLQVVYGDWLLFQKSMVAWRQHEFVFPPQVVFRYLKIFVLVEKDLLVFWVAFLEFISMVVYFALTYFVAKRVRLSYAVLMFFILLLPTFTGTFAGMPRYILHTFPAFIGLALFLRKRTFLKPLVIILFLLLGFVFTALFTRGYFIA